MSLSGKHITPELKEQWLAERKLRIGGSEIASCMGLNKYDSKLRIWLSKTGKLPPKEPTEAMDIGSALESGIMDLYRARTGKTVSFTQIFFVSPEHDYLCATLDGITDDSINVQIKNVGCASVNYWGPDGSDEIPHSVFLQVQQEMHCSGLELTHVGSF